MSSIPLVILSYSWLLRNHKGYSDEELATALYWLGASWYDHISDDNNIDASWTREDGDDPQARIKPFIAKAVEDGRYRRVTRDDVFNEELAKLGLPPMEDGHGFANRPQMREHLDKLGVRYADR